MSQQNIFGNDLNNGCDESQSLYGVQGVVDVQLNFYFGMIQVEFVLDLDVVVLQLCLVEEQWLNCKVLLFFGGIVLLLMVMGFLLFCKGQDDVIEQNKSWEEVCVMIL